MRGYTHVLFNIILLILVLKYNLVKLNKIELLIVIFLLPFFSLLPDMDRKFIKHRTIMHSFTFYMPLLFIFLISKNSIILILFLFITSHLLLDALNIQGIYPFYPLRFKIKGFIKTSSFLEHIFFSLLLLILFYVVRA